MYALLTKGRDGTYKNTLANKGWTNTGLKASWGGEMEVYSISSKFQELPVSEGGDTVVVFGFVATTHPEDTTEEEETATEWTYIGVEGACMTDNCGSAGSYWDNTLDNCDGNCYWGAHYRKNGLSVSECEAEATSRDFVVAYAHSTNNECWLYVEGNGWDGTGGWSGSETSQHARIGCTYKPSSHFTCYLRTA